MLKERAGRVRQTRPVFAYLLPKKEPCMSNTESNFIVSDDLNPGMKLSLPPSSHGPLIVNGIGVEIMISTMPGCDDLIPAYQTAGAAAFDLMARETVVIPVEGRKVVPTGIMVAIPEGLELQIRPRSGLAKQGVTITNSPATIDSDYRGEIGVIIENRTASVLRFERGDRIAQGAICPVYRAVWKPVQDLPPTERGGGGFGHTGRS